jgi:hypothetical protein
MTVVGYISATVAIIKAFCTIFQNAGAAAFNLIQSSSAPPNLGAKDLFEARTEVFNVHQIKTIDLHSTDSDE